MQTSISPVAVYPATANTLYIRSIGLGPPPSYYYESATLGQLLPFVIASVIDGTVLEQAQEMIRDGQPKGSSSPAEGGNLLANLINIKTANTISNPHPLQPIGK